MINGNIDELLFEGETIQSRLHHINTPKSIGELSKKFALLMEKGNVNGALKLLTSNISNGILPLDDKTLTLLKEQHPASSELNEQVLLRRENHPYILQYLKILTSGKRNSIRDQRLSWSFRTRRRWMEKDSCVQELQNN